MFTNDKTFDSKVSLCHYDFILRFSDFAGRSQGGGARGQNLELAEICYLFLFINRNNLGRRLVIHLSTLYE